MIGKTSPLSPEARTQLPCTPEEENQWHLHVFSAWQQTFHNISEVRALLAHPVKIIQENNRGIVFLIRYNGILFIAKRSLIQENKRWAQFTSCYRQGEGMRTLRNMDKLYKLNLPVPEPVFVLEKKKYGFVVASWSLYRYLEGHPCSCGQSDQIAATLRKIHEKGWVHRDPHVKNFLLHEGEIRIIDCTRARAWRLSYAQMYDVVLLNNCCPGSLRQYGVSETHLIYRLAKCQNTMIKLWRRIKKKLRSFGKNR